MKDSLWCDFDFDQAAAGLDRITSAAEEATRPAAQAGAQVFYDEVRALVPVSSEGDHWFYGTHGKYLLKQGALRDAIYQVYSKDQSGPAHSMYHIAWNHKEAPHGFMVEFGTSRAAAHPFLRPAYDNVKEYAVQAVMVRMQQEVQKVLQ